MLRRLTRPLRLLRIYYLHHLRDSYEDAQRGVPDNLFRHYVWKVQRIDEKLRRLERDEDPC